MSVPKYEAMMRPVLELLSARGRLAFRDIAELVASEMGIDDADRARSIASGQAVYVNRVGWAITYLVQAGAVRRPQRAIAEITDRGRALLATTSGPVGNSHLAQFDEFQAFRRRTRAAGTPSVSRGVGDGPAGDRGAEDVAESGRTPEEILTETVDTAHAALTGELLDRVMELTPIAFERLVLRLLAAMKYGASGTIESTAATGDAGIDGVISQDPLGLDRIYVQAKRYSRDRTVGRPAMQAFVGALQGQQADRGVFLTTCRFTSDALTYADRVGVRIIPVDGDELAALMLKHGVGVQPRFAVSLLAMDEDFFETL